MRVSHADRLRTIDSGELGSRLRRARLASGLTQTELAGEDISVGYVSRIETGDRRPKLDVLTTLAERLDARLDDLLHDAGAQDREEIRLGLDYVQLALETGESREAEQQARTLRARAAEIDSADLAHRATYLHARALEALGDVDAAITGQEDVVAQGSGLVVLEAAIALCRCLRETGDFTLAIESGEAVLAGLDESGLAHTDEAVQLAATTASAYVERGDLHRAMRICDAALSRAEEVATPKARASAAWQASIVHSHRGDLSTATRLASRALALLSEGQDRRNLVRLRVQVASLRLREDPSQAASVIADLTAVRAEQTDSSASRIERARAGMVMAHAHLVTGEPELALHLTDEAREAAGDRAAQLQVEALVIRGQALTALGRSEEASAAYREGVTLLTGAGADRSAAQLWFELAELLEGVGEETAARHAYRSAAASTGLVSRAPQWSPITAPPAPLA
ncbi:helix-turn-helix domain-containing protein [Nocardioides panacisoli]|uniref:helix-turn-helix domain-containing protein n=1 Tax=Nocardioides panacisoli TaxID=627624 RepID=UPI001C628FBD|nr:helix-turn-helix domain-containing protein [Nocardioides panacisoli]QYJ02688.1 helix-turn-helix domain-containing protein [Nocardioides panacisoli]